MLLDKKSPRGVLRHSNSLDNVSKVFTPAKFERKTTEVAKEGMTGADTDPGLEFS